MKYHHKIWETFTSSLYSNNITYKIKGTVAGDYSGHACYRT
jgi:hypothetical protein